TIKGSPNEDAVLCTGTKTYAIRSIVLSNSVLITTPPSDTDFGDTQMDNNADESKETIVIRDQVNELLELTPCVPRLHRLTSMLRDAMYTGEEDLGEEYAMVDCCSDAFWRDSDASLTYDAVLTLIQASNGEIERGLEERRILNVNGNMRRIAPDHLTHIIELTLTLLASLSLSHSSASVERLTTAMADSHEIPRLISTQVLGWFGKIQDGKWCMDVDKMMREAGLGLLRQHRLHDPIAKHAFFDKWHSFVGDTFSESVKLELLAGNYLSQKKLSGQETLTYFPSSLLPVDPAARFAELFLARARWKGEDLVHFLSDIALDSKERDRLLLKHTRAIKDAETTWYTARAQYNG
ncbi:hypothetical protein FISHEDRAFT_41449, partial [Fistulina hepatica ATCC 64428]